MNLHSTTCRFFPCWHFSNPWDSRNNFNEFKLIRKNPWYVTTVLLLPLILLISEICEEKSSSEGFLNTFYGDKMLIQGITVNLHEITENREYNVLLMFLNKKLKMT